MLSLPDPDDYGLPEPSRGAPPNSLAAPFVPPSYERPPMDHDGVRLQLGRPIDTLPVYMPRPALSEHDVVTCMTLDAEGTTPHRRSQHDGHVLARHSLPADDWARHCGSRLDRVGAHDLAEFCVGHELRLTLPATYFPTTNKTHPFTGPRAVRVYDSFASPTTPLQVAVYFLDLMGYIHRV